jgi:hypothetical protein
LYVKAFYEKFYYHICVAGTSNADKHFTKPIARLQLLHVLLTQVPESRRQEAKQYNHSYAERLVHGRHGAQISNALDGLLQELL